MSVKEKKRKKQIIYFKPFLSTETLAFSFDLVETEHLLKF